MNDRYLFKAKRKNWKELPQEEWWVQGYYVFCRKHHYILPVISEITGYDERYDEWLEIDESTLCQCTGRRDEWEHDIFEFDDDRYEIVYCEDLLTWDAVSVFSSESINLGEFSQNEYIRIGNTIDNTVLMEME